MMQNIILSQPTLFSALLVIGSAVISLRENGVHAFQSTHLMPTSMHRTIDADRIGLKNRGQFRYGKHNSLLFASPSDDESESVQRLFDYESSNFESEVSDEELEELEMGQPPEWMVMQQLLGINAFTFVLAALIVFFLSMNIMLGPGWLGNQIGIPGTGSIQEVSPSLPGSIDLNKPEYRL